MNLLDISPDKLTEILRTDPARGLSSYAVGQNRQEFGKNAPSDSLFAPLFVLKSLFSNVLFCMFLALSLFSLFTENRDVGLVCLVTAAVSYFLFFFYCMRRAEPLTAAKRALSHKYTVLRDGKRTAVYAADIVPGDLLFIQRKESVPCDGILLSAKELKVCQVQIDSRAQCSKYSYSEVLESGRDGERYRLYCGSVILSGEGMLLVCNTGKNIVKTTISARQRGTLPRALRTASEYERRLSLGLIVLTTFLFLAGTFTGVDAYSNFFLLCTISVAILPELSEALTRLVLILPLNRLKEQGCLVQNYACLDALLKVDRILVDSAAYFLDADIRPASYFYANYPRSVREVSEGLFTLISYARLCCFDRPKKKEQMWYGKSSVDAAICRTAPEFGIDEPYLNRAFLTIARAAYDEERGFSAAMVLNRERCYQIIRGRPTEVLDRCTHSLQEKRSVALSAAAKARLYQAADQLSAGGEVVVAIARRYFRSVPEDVQAPDAQYMTFVGFLTFHTPMRPESATAVEACRKDGLEVLLCTDSDPDSTLGIARSMGFFSPEETPRVLTGEKARAMDEAALSRELETARVFCNLNAVGKRAVVKAQQNAGHTTLVCTHSLTDSLAQEAADVNVVCTRERTPALIHNADILLTGEKFELLPELLRLSRTVSLNSLRILRFSILLMVALFSCAFFSLLFGEANLLVQPFSALLLGLGFFLFAAVTLSTDSQLVTSLKPIGEEDFITSTLKDLCVYAGGVGFSVGAATVLTHLLTSLFSHPAEASAACLVTLFFSVLFALVSARKTKPFKTAEFHHNLRLYLCVPICLALLALLICVGAVRTHLGLLVPHPLSLPICLALSTLPFFAGEALKHVKLRKKRK